MGMNSPSKKRDAKSNDAKPSFSRGGTVNSIKILSSASTKNNNNKTANRGFFAGGKVNNKQANQ